MRLFARSVAIPKWKNWEGDIAGPRQKVGGSKISLSCMVIFRCNEDWLAMINPIKPNTGLWKSSEPLPGSLQIFTILLAERVAWLKIIHFVYMNQTDLNMKLSTKLGEPSRGPAKNLRDMAHPGHSLEPPLCPVSCGSNINTVNRIYSCSSRKLLYQLFTSKGGVRLTHEMQVTHALRSVGVRYLQ